MTTGSGQLEDMIKTAVGICGRHGDEPAALIEILHDLQEALGHVPDAALPTVAKRLNIARAEVHGVVSFYHDFRSAPIAGVSVKVCRAEACQAMGAASMIDRAIAQLAVGDAVTIEPVYCLGNCALAPAAMVDGRLYGRLNTDRLVSAVRGAQP
ncbi:MAG: NAD(P)H-dependent oxidoreductase subunit E [Alphaproteobacteria bacterium]|jgi:formate dehydrogenase subunit gamma